MNRHVLYILLLFDIVWLMSVVIIVNPSTASAHDSVVDREIAVAAQQLKGLNDTATVQNTLDFVNREMVYEEFYWPRGLYDTWNEKAGDCSDFSLLTVALLKANGIRARQVSGWVIDENGTRQRHAWVEATIWIDPLWDDMTRHEKRKNGMW